jgi:hypothetical protein
MDVFLTEGVGRESIDRVTKLLSGIPGGIQKAIYQSMKRAATAGEAHAAKVISSEYYISSGTFKAETTSHKKVISDGEGTTVELRYFGRPIPLAKFKVSVGADGRVRANVKRSGGGGDFDRIFQSSVGSHAGLFERVGESRLPIREVFGPSTPGMMHANETVAEEISEKVRETFEQRLEHEMLRIMNGWGGG